MSSRSRGIDEHGLRSVFITVAERDLLLPRALTRPLVNHAPPNNVAESCAAAPGNEAGPSCRHRAMR